MKQKKNSDRIYVLTYIVILLIFCSLSVLYGYKNVTLNNALKTNSEINYRSFLHDVEFYSNINKTVFPKDIFQTLNMKHSYSLVYFYAGGECEKCIVSDIDRIKELLLPEFSDRVFIFPVFNYSRDYEIKSEAVMTGLIKIRIDPTKIIMPEINNMPTRFFAILSKDGEIINRYFPDQLMPEKTDIFIQYVKEKYLKD